MQLFTEFFCKTKPRNSSVVGYNEQKQGFKQALLEFTSELVTEIKIESVSSNHCFICSGKGSYGMTAKTEKLHLIEFLGIW